MNMQHTTRPRGAADGALRRHLRIEAPLDRATVTVRPIEAGDAAALARVLNTDAISRFIPRPPGTPARFRDFILWTQAEQRAGRQQCFAIVPQLSRTAAG